MVSLRGGLPDVTGLSPQAAASTRPLTAWGPDLPLVDLSTVGTGRGPAGRERATSFMGTAAREVGDALIVVAVLGRFFALVAVMLVERRFGQLRRGAEA
jgi:hypothetical protein